jgi:hypothetical protein
MYLIERRKVFRSSTMMCLLYKANAYKEKTEEKSTILFSYWCVVKKVVADVTDIIIEFNTLINTSAVYKKKEIVIS